MHPSQKYLNPRELANLQGLQLRARAIVDGFLAGRHRSSGRGLSLEFTEHREYAPGDDWRHIDWKVYGRTDKYHLKQFEDEANLSCYFLIDCSESMAYRGPDSTLSKLDYAKCVAASLAWLIKSQQDAVGLATFADGILNYVPARHGTAAMSDLLQILEETSANGHTNFAAAVNGFLGQVSRRSVVVAISDWYSDLADIDRGMQHLVHEKHDVSALQIVDPAEIDFPFKSNMLFEGMESASNITTDASAIAQAYRKRFAEFCKTIRLQCGGHSVKYHQIRTDESFAEPLSAFLSPAQTSF